MQKRNFNILVVSACIAIICVWLSVYNFVRLDINPIKYTQENFQTIVEGEEQDDDETVIEITGKVTEKLRLSLSEIKSGNYRQVKNKVFKMVTQVEPHYYKSSGATLWSIIESILESDASTFTFVGSDGYESPKALSIDDVAKKYETDVILAYEINGEPIYQDGPIRSVIDDDACPDEYSSQYWVSNLAEVRIE